MKYCSLLTLLICLLAACQPQSAEDVVIPTLIDLNAIATNAAASTATANANLPPTLPPTWTPPPAPTVVATAVPPTLLPAATGLTDTTEVVSQGTIFYIFNGDSIVRLSPGGGSEDLIYIGRAPADLAAAPDGSYLAFTAQGNGSAREVFITKPDGSETQVISCLGFARVLQPTWSPDGYKLAFAGSQTPDGPLGVYIANVGGSATCPGGNNQRQIVQLEDNQLFGITWSPDSNWLFFSHGVISAANLGENAFYPGIIPRTGYGPNLSPAYSPVDSTLVYLKSERDDKNQRTGGVIYQFNPTQITPPVKEFRGAAVFSYTLDWSRDGRYLLAGGERDIWVQDQRAGSAQTVLSSSNFMPQPVFSPDAQWIAYVDGGQTKYTIPQVFTIKRSGENATQITFHQEGTISDLVWTPG